MLRLLVLAGSQSCASVYYIAESLSVPRGTLLESRRSFVGSMVSSGAAGVVAVAASLLASGPQPHANAAEAQAHAADLSPPSPPQPPPSDNSGVDSESAAMAATTFKTRAYGQAEYTNSITASRDTNISPKEAYDVIRQQIPVNTRGNQGRALDLGAGAGLSTAVLYLERGYRTVDAVDWSDVAWAENVLDPLPSTVRWYESDDDRFLSTIASPKSYHVIVYNFAINPDKAYRVARQYLAEDGDGTGGGLLLAPVNDRADYWYKQSYLLLNSSGDVLWRSDPEVGAWSVQFQPDVTSDTCTGIWCGAFNGFQQKQQQWRQKK